MTNEVKENPDVQRYIAEIKAYDSKFKNWKERCKKIEKRLRDDEEDITSSEPGSPWGKCRFNVLYTTTQVFKPATYSRPGNPECERRWKDRDPLGRFAAELEERLAKHFRNQERFHRTMISARDDLILFARNSVWLRYEVEWGDPILDENGQKVVDDSGKPIRSVKEERVVPDYVCTVEDFGHNVCRNEDEIYLKWRHVCMDRDEVRERFGEDIANVLSYSVKQESIDDSIQKEAEEFNRKALITELWDEKKRKAFWLCKDYAEKFLDEKEDPHSLKDFFPCPRSCYGLTTPRSLVPVPDFGQFKYQADILDELVARTRMIIETVAIRGVRDAANVELQRLTESSRENFLIAVKDWMKFKEFGGLKGSFELMPLDQQVNVLSVLDEQFKVQLDRIYELTGLPDIIRGQSAPSESATAQQIKGDFAMSRLKERQQAMQVFCRDTIAVGVDMMLAHFSEETIAKICKLEEFPEEIQKWFPDALKLLRDDQQREYTISLETDSTLSIDESMDKQKRIEFLQATGQYLQAAIQTIQMAPETAPMVFEMLLFGVRSFKPGRNIEYSIEQSIDAIKEKLQQPPPQQPPDPKMMELQQKANIEQGKIQTQEQIAQMKAEIQKLQAILDYQIDQEKIASDEKLAREKIVVDANIKRETAQINAASKQQPALLGGLLPGGFV